MWFIRRNNVCVSKYFRTFFVYVFSITGTLPIDELQRFCREYWQLLYTLLILMATQNIHSHFLWCIINYNGELSCNRCVFEKFQKMLVEKFYWLTAHISREMLSCLNHWLHKEDYLNIYVCFSSSQFND